MGTAEGVAQNAHMICATITSKLRSLLLPSPIPAPWRANAFPWDNPTDRLGFALIWKWTCCHFRSQEIAVAVFVSKQLPKEGCVNLPFSSLKQTGERAIKNQFKPDFSKWAAKKLPKWQTIHRCKAKKEIGRRKSWHAFWILKNNLGNYASSKIHALSSWALWKAVLWCVLHACYFDK